MIPLLIVGILVALFANDASGCGCGCCGCCCPCCCCKPIVIKLPPPPTKICPCCCCCRPCCCCCCPCCCGCCGCGGGGGGYGKRKKRDALDVLAKELVERGTLTMPNTGAHLQQRDSEMPLQLQGCQAGVNLGGNCGDSMQQQQIHPGAGAVPTVLKDAAVICNKIPPEQQGPLCAEFTQRQNQLFLLQQQQKLNAHLLNLHNNRPLAMSFGPADARHVFDLNNNNNNAGMSANGCPSNVMGCGSKDAMDCAGSSGGNGIGCDENCANSCAECESFCGDGRCSGANVRHAQSSPLGMNTGLQLEQGAGGIGLLRRGPCTRLCGGGTPVFASASDGIK